MADRVTQELAALFQMALFICCQQTCSDLQYLFHVACAPPIRQDCSAPLVRFARCFVRSTCGTNTTLYFGGSNSPWSLVDAEQAFNSTSGITTYLGNLTTDTVPLSDGTFGCAAFQANGSDFEYVLGTSNVKSMACPTAIDNFGTSSSYTLSKTSECGAAPSPSPGASPASPLYGIYRLTDEDDDGSTMVVTST